VNITNFTSAWRDGLAFAALIHSHHPEALDFDALLGKDDLKILQTAFAAAEKVGVPSIIDPEDVLVGPHPDHFSIMTYLSAYAPPPATNGNLVVGWF